MTAPLNSVDANMFEITPSDTVALRVPTDMIYVGTQGNLVVKTVQGETVTFVGASGWMHTPGITHVLAASTAAAIVGVASKALR